VAVARPSTPRPDDRVVQLLHAVHRDILALRPRGFGPPVHGPAIDTRLFLVGQAPGPHEARLGRPFAWTAGKTLFRWLGQATGAGEDEVRTKLYIAAVVRCFPGKVPAGGDRVPTPAEVERWRGFLEREVQILRPRLVLPVGRLAIAEVLGSAEPLAGVVGRQLRTHYHGLEVDVIPLPHPSGASTWFKVEPGRTLLARALELVAQHPEVRRTFRRSR
jgi:uracil-DNA glycosylase